MQSKDGLNRPDAPGPGEFSNPPLSRFVDEHPALVEELRQFDLVRLVSLVGGLLVHPGWQGSSIRLQVLQHLAVATASGRREPRALDLQRWLNEFGQGFAGKVEDPAEDVFVSRIILPDRDCLIFRGTDEGSTYYLQRFVEILQELPDGEPYASLWRAARGLLTLSDAIAERAGITAFAVGEALPLKQVEQVHLQHLADFGAHVVFNRTDLADLGVDPSDLTYFVFNLDDRSRLLSDNLGHSALERRPILLSGDRIVIAAPSAVSIAIRRAVIELCIAQGRDEVLYRAYTHVVAEACRGMPLLGAPPVSEIPFRREENLHVANLYQYVDEGRLVHLCFLVDDFTGYAESGTVRPNPESSRLERIIDQHLADARGSAHPGEVREGISVIVACLWGRPFVVQAADFDDKRWRVIALSVADFASLSWLPQFSPLDLWRTLDECEAIEKMNIELVNPNGFLNLYAWIKDFDTEQRRDIKLPHWDPEQLGPPLHIVLPVNALLLTRKESAEAWNHHHARTWDGRSVQVRRQLPRSVSPANYSLPLYVSMDDVISRKLLSVFETRERGWWTAVETPNSEDPRVHFRLWEACGIWIGRAAPVLEREISPLPAGPLAWLCRFEDSDEVKGRDLIPDPETARALVTVEARDNVIYVTAGDSFLTTLRHAKNVTERLLVEALVEGAFRLSGGDPPGQRVEEITREIVPDDWARAIHHFEAFEFRQFLQSIRLGERVVPSERDEAYSRLNLGWRMRKRSEGTILEGRETCCEYLNRLVDSVWADMQLTLKQYRREPLLMMLAENHEAIMVESERWLQSARSYISLYSTAPEAAGHAASQTATLAAAAIATRILIEMALCECPESAGQKAGTLDIVRLLANAMHLYVLGGWSEAIRFGAKKAEIRITPLGDLDTQSDFDDEIGNPYTATLVTRRFVQGAESYEERFVRHDSAESARDLFEPEFWEAWSEAFGCTIDEVRAFIDNLEDEAMRLKTFAFVTDLAGLRGLDGFVRLGSDTVAKILDMFTLRARQEWSATPRGFSRRDWYPWRYRRRLSVISRPILQFNATGEARYLVAPGMVRDGFRKVLDYCHDGGYDAKNFPPGRMRSWIGSTENKRGHKFNLQVAERLRQLGWQARANVALTEILNAKLPRNYGDVDALAWRDGRVLAIECKDLELAMTIGEIARQLYEFRGETVEGKPDRLKKHLIRTEVLQQQASAVARFAGIAGTAQIEGWLVLSDLGPVNFSNITAEHPIHITTLERLSAI
jgi:hypothetical protein